jgi:hypothetical protein
LGYTPESQNKHTTYAHDLGLSNTQRQQIICRSFLEEQSFVIFGSYNGPPVKNRKRTQQESCHEEAAYSRFQSTMKSFRQHMSNWQEQQYRTPEDQMDIAAAREVRACKWDFSMTNCTEPDDHHPEEP